jgi:putative cardiolipin synthase
VRLNTDGELEWVDSSGSDDVVYLEEPLTDTWRRFQAGFYGLLPLEGEL